MAHFAVEDDRPKEAVAAEEAFRERVRARHREAAKAQERAKLEAEWEEKRAESRVAEEQPARPVAAPSSPQRKAARAGAGSGHEASDGGGAERPDAAQAEEDSLSDTASSGSETEGTLSPQRRRAAVRRRVEEQAQTLGSSRAAPPVSDPALRRRKRESARGARSRYAGMATLQALGAEDEDEYWGLKEGRVREETGSGRGTAPAPAVPAPGPRPPPAQRRTGPSSARERGGGAAAVAASGEVPPPARSQGGEERARSKPQRVRHQDRVAHLAAVDPGADLVRPGGTRGGSRSLRRARALAKRLGLSLEEALGREEERLTLRTVPERVFFGEVPQGWHVAATIALRNHTEEVVRYRIARPRVTTAADVDAALTGAQAREPVWAQPTTVTVVQSPGGVAAGMDKTIAVHLRARQAGELEEQVQLVTEYETLVVPVHAVVTPSEEAPGDAPEGEVPNVGAGVRVVGRVRGWKRHWSSRSAVEDKLVVGTASADSGDEDRGASGAAESGGEPYLRTTHSSGASPPATEGENKQVELTGVSEEDQRAGVEGASGDRAVSGVRQEAPQAPASSAPRAAAPRAPAPANGPHLGPTADMTEAERRAADAEAERYLFQKMARSARR